MTDDQLALAIVAAWMLLVALLTYIFRKLDKP